MLDKKLSISMILRLKGYRYRYGNTTQMFCEQGKGEFMKYLFVGLSIIALASGCAATSINSVKTAYMPKTAYDRIMLSIASGTNDFAYRAAMEKKIITLLSQQSSTEFIPATDYFTPNNQVSEKNQAALFKKLKLDGVVMIYLTGDESWTQNTTLPTFSPIFGFVGSNSVRMIAQGSQQISTNKRAWSYSINLWDIMQKKWVWFASAQTQGSDYDSMVYSTIHSSVHEFLKSGLIKLRHPVKG